MVAMALFLLLLLPYAAAARSTATLQGRAHDATDATVPAATITVRDPSTSFDRTAVTDVEGRHQIAAIPAGRYEVTASAAGFRSEIIEELSFDVGRTVVRDFRLEVGDRRETVLVSAELPIIDRATATVGHVVTAQTVHEIPLNGRHFIDLGLLVPGSVTPSQTGFSTTPICGTGSLAINTAGNREEAVAFVVNGVTSNNLTFGALMFEPPVASIQEFTVDNSAFSAEYGHVSGGIVNIVTRSGTDALRGDAHGFVRNEALDARNLFEFTSPEPHRFERTQFGGSMGGPVIRGRSFFFAIDDGLRQRQGLDMNSLVLNDSERAAATDPIVRRLIELIPRPNIFDVSGTPRFVGAAEARVDRDRWTIDLRHTVNERLRLHGFYERQRIKSIEPSSQGTTVPGFGQESRSLRTLLTLDGTAAFGPALVNEARFGIAGLDGEIVPRARLNPAEYGIASEQASPGRPACRR
jgi:Carboxypeptidase regulatory-like domain